MAAILIFSLLGLSLSLYAYTIEQKSKNKHYRAACDLNERISCSKAFTSRYGKLFGISNSLIGIFFYVAIFLLFFINKPLIFYFAFLSVLSSFDLGYIQFFKMNNFCIVCNAIYVINLFLLLFSLL